MVDFNFFIIYVGMANPGQFCGKSISKSKQVEYYGLKQGWSVIFSRRTPIVKLPLIAMLLDRMTANVFYDMCEGDNYGMQKKVMMELYYLFGTRVCKAWFVFTIAYT